MFGRRRSTWKGLAAGLVGGLAASWVMNVFQAGWSAVQKEISDPEKRKAKRNPEEENATVKAARAISAGIFGHELTVKEKKWAGPAVHYAFGTAVGGLYGAAAEHRPRIAAATGVPFGAGFWLTADEIGVPLLRLSKPPDRYPVSTHAYALASHLVYGATAELVRRGMRRLL